MQASFDQLLGCLSEDGLLKVKDCVSTSSCRRDPSSTRGGVSDDELAPPMQAVLVNADAFKLQQLVGRRHLPPALNRQLDESLVDGCVLKVRAGSRVRQQRQ